jgi:hypothetical protein
VACTREAPPAPPPPGAPSACDGLHPGGSPLRRLTRFEYDNTVRDLLGDTSAPARGFVAEEEALGFDNQATALGVPQLLAEQYMEAAEALAHQAMQAPAKLLPCDPAKAGEEACAGQLITQLGKRAYRRPLKDEEVNRLTKLYAWGKKQYDFSTGIELVIQAMLQSPHFLYRVEMGMPDPAAPGVVALRPYELASRLSYLLWGSMPDEALFAAADAGALGTAAEIQAQAERMLDDPRARQAVGNFHEQWLGLRALDTLSKDTSVYPAYDESLRPLWKEETTRFLEQVVFEDDKGDVATMLTAPYSMMNGPLANFYGLIGGPTGDDFERVTLDPGQRTGFLTHAGILAVNAKPNQSSPIHRGKFVRERLLCQIMPLPPNDVAIKAPDIDPGATTRQKFSEHETDPACSGCHHLMDPIGFGFEHYDGIGRWRDQDHGFPVDATGDIQGTTDSDGPFDGAVELGARLSQSEQVRQCIATQWFRFGYGHAEGSEDACVMAELQGAFKASGYSIKALLVALTQTQAFRYRPAVEAGK